MAIEEKWKRIDSDGLKSEQRAKRGRDTLKNFYYSKQNNFISKMFFSFSIGEKDAIICPLLVEVSIS